MPHATRFKWYDHSKKKLKSFIDFPLGPGENIEQIAPVGKSISKKPENTPSASPVKETKPIPKTPIPTPQIPRQKTYQPGRTKFIRINEPETADEKKANTPAKSFGKNKFSYDELLKHWADYAKIIEAKEGGFASSILTKNKPELKGENVINQVFDNETGRLKFSKFSGALTLYLKEKLQNDGIRITTEVNKEKSEQKLYTNKDKFEHLLKENPELVDWVKRFNLDIDV